MNDQKFVPFGIYNLGNTCFINSCLQILCNLDSFSQVLKNKQHIHESCPEIAIWKNLENICENKIVAGGSQKAVLNPRGFIQAVQYVAKLKNEFMWCGNMENDFLEFLLFLIECLHTCIKRQNVIVVEGDAKHETDKLAVICYAFLKSHYDKDFSEIYELFQGILVSTISSPGEARPPEEVHSRNPEMFFTLDLPIKSLCFQCSLYDCLNTFFEKEILEKENAWYNEKTREKETVIKSFFIFRFPPVLWISMKRFSFNGTAKIKTRVEFPQTLNMESYCSGYYASSQIYNLYAICNHFGSLNHGHYNCCIKKGEEWFLCDDDNVAPVSEEMVLKMQSEVYCLVYVKRNNKNM